MCILNHQCKATWNTGTRYTQKKRQKKIGLWCKFCLKKKSSYLILISNSNDGGSRPQPALHAGQVWPQILPREMNFDPWLVGCLGEVDSFPASPHPLSPSHHRSALFPLLIHLSSRSYLLLPFPASSSPNPLLALLYDNLFFIFTPLQPFFFVLILLPSPYYSLPSVSPPPPHQRLLPQ